MSSAAMNPLLTIEDLSLELRRDTQWNPILHHIQFSLSEGETLGIVGESGSGKSVTALSVMQLLNPGIARYPSGRILFHADGSEQPPVNVLTAQESVMQSIRGNKIGMIFQEPMTSLNPVIRCGEQITEQILLHKKVSEKEAKEQVLNLFDEVMLPRPKQIFDSYPHELSGGQKQRIMIAMAMSCNPKLLIADEPTTALDVTIQKNILELIRTLQHKHGMGVLFITHDLGVVAEIADRAIVMYKGEMVEDNNVRDLFLNPQKAYTKQLIACRPSMTTRLRKLPQVSDFEGNDEADMRQITENLTVKPEERKAAHQLLYAGDKIVSIRNLNKIYKVRKRKLFEKQQYFHALHDVSLDIYEGETLGLVGESGCGKTTLGRSMLRLIEPSSGEVLYRGRNLLQLPMSEMRKMRKDLQIILQDPYSSLNQRLTIGEALMEPMRVHNLLHNDKERKQRVIELLERVSLNESHFYRYPHEFSGGQRQRISIARALAVNPKFIICDESVSALDVSVQAQVLNLLNELKSEYHFTYIFISHDLSVVKFMADRIAVMQQGVIVETAEADTLCAHPQTDYTRKLIDSIPKGVVG
ncbi:MAG: ABC transporter ATP-binding protein [Bacteroidales bacterium]|nr:ABC transporter ATP-binding protein [Bacteroidales bacterium]